ncbi:MAG: carbohydrate ABC transporter permease [Armatimonadetes bacterium]|nr:carbohydrate ABC transporter permease [Armatimonadota bacterium]
MSQQWLFVVGAVLTWVGWFAVFRAALFAFRAWFGAAFENSADLKKRAVTASIVAGVCLLIGAFMPMETGLPQTEPWSVPLVWFMAPFQGLFAFGSAVFMVIYAVKAISAITAAERAQRLNTVAIWAGVCGLWVWWFVATDGAVTVFRGEIQMSPAKVIGLVVLAIAAIAVMVYTERNARTRGLAKSVVTHITLVAGCVVFGLPFIWLLITSFKEDRDITTTAGMVWIPRVQQVVAFTDVRNPLYEFRSRGNKMRGVIAEERTGGRVLMEIERPFGYRGRRVVIDRADLVAIQRLAPVVSTIHEGVEVVGYVIEEMEGGERRVNITEPESRRGEEIVVAITDTDPVREIGLRWQNYTEMLEWLPPDTNHGLVYVKNTMILVIMSVIGTLISSVLVGYGFSRLRFPGRNFMFIVMLATLMLPGAVTMLPTFLIFRSFGWIDTLYPIWVPTFFAGAFNVFLLMQFFRTIPMELEDAAKIDGCTYVRTLFQIMVPQIKPALAVIAIWTFLGAWNNFMGPLIYISTPENMPIAYALQIFQGERGAEFGLMMAFSTLATIPVLLLFFFAQRYFIEGVQLSGLGGR